MKSSKLILLLLLFFVHSACLTELSQLVTGGGDGSTTTIAAEEVGSSDGSVSNATELGSEDLGSAGSDEVTYESVESGGSESGTDAGETSLDSEGFATLPVTPPKAINALTISVSDSGLTDAGIFNSVFSSQAFAQELGDDETSDTEESTCRIIGKASTVEADADLVLMDMGHDEFLEFKSESDGSFDIGVPAEYEGQSITLTYLVEDGEYDEQLVDIKIDTDCADYTVGITQASLAIQEDMAVDNSTVIYNQTSKTGENQIIVQSMKGDDGIVFAITPTPLTQMQYFDPVVNKEKGVKHDKMILGIDSYNNLVRVGPDGTFTLNDNVHTASSDGSSTDGTAEGFAFQAAQASGRFSVVFSKDILTLEDELTLIPANPDAGDLSFSRAFRPGLTKRTMAWMNTRLLLCMDQLSVNPAATSEESADTSSLIITYNLGDYTSLTEDELIALGTGSSVELTPSRIMGAQASIRNPVMSPWKRFSETPFMIFEAKVNNSYKLGISDYTHAKIFANISGRIVKKSLSRYGDLVAMQIFGGAERGSNILIFHLPTMTSKWLIDPDKFDKGMALISPVFSTKDPYALSYQMEFKGSSRQIGVINLLYHPFFKTILTDEEPNYDIDHIMVSDDYVDLVLTEIPSGSD